MVRRRLADDEKADKGETGNGCGTAGSDDLDKRNAIKGYKKIAAVFLFFIALTLIRRFVVDIALVSGHSMDDTFAEGEVLIVDVGGDELTRYDVVIALTDDKKLIKRVIGLPHEVIHIKDGKVYVNGRELEGEYAFYTESAGVAGEPYELGEDEYFLLGDNRGGSMDSRDFGSIDIEDIHGIVIYRIFPFDRMGDIPHSEEHKME